MIDEKYHKALVRADKEFVAKRTEFERAREAFLKAKEELENWEELNEEMVVNVKKRHFSFPWHFHGGANLKEKKWGKVETIYMTPQEWMETEKEVTKWGTGYTLEKVND